MIKRNDCMYFVSEVIKITNISENIKTFKFINSNETF
jgi:hypothetical protein